MKQEFERIWREKPCAYPMNIAGWLTPIECQKLHVGHKFVSDLLRSVRGRRYVYWRCKPIRWK